MITVKAVVLLPIIAGMLGGCVATSPAIRASHLSAHLAQTALMTRAQVEKYTAVRGYQAGGQHETRLHN